MVDLEVKAAINQIVLAVERMVDNQGSKKHFFSVSGWVSHRPINIYVRTQLRRCGTIGMKVITIANIEIAESYQRKGVFKELLENLTTLARLRDYDAVVVESINNPHLKDYLFKVGFELIHESENMIAPTVYKKVSK